jgi:hypothetical protein
MTQHHATIYRDDAGEYRWNVRAANYEERAGAVRGLSTAHPEFAGEDLSDTDSVTVDVGSGA